VHRALSDIDDDQRAGAFHELSKGSRGTVTLEHGKRQLGVGAFVNGKAVRQPGLELATVDGSKQDAGSPGGSIAGHGHKGLCQVCTLKELDFGPAVLEDDFESWSHGFACVRLFR
jgi:hypothetical protein